MTGSIINFPRDVTDRRAKGPRPISLTKGSHPLELWNQIANLGMILSSRVHGDTQNANLTCPDDIQTRRKLVVVFLTKK